MPLDIVVSDAERVRFGGMWIETPSDELAIAVCHALVPLLGPHELDLEGSTIVVDGETAPQKLTKDHLERRSAELEAARDRALLAMFAGSPGRR